MPFPKNKQISVCFHLNSGAGPEINRALMQELNDFYYKNRDDFPENHKLWIPHNVIPQKWSKITWPLGTDKEACHTIV